MRSKALNVLYLDHTARLGGGETALLRLLEAMPAQKVQPHVLLGEDGAFAEAVKGLGLGVTTLPLDERVREYRKDSVSPLSVTRLRPAATVFRYAVNVARLARQLDVQIIHCNSLKSDVYGWFAAKLAKRPVVWHVRDHIAAPYLPRRTAALLRFCARRLPSHVIANSKSTLNTLWPQEADSLRRATVVHDGLTPRELERGRELGCAHWEMPLHVGLVGRLAPWKGQDVFIKAAHRVLSQGVDAHFHIVGSAMFGEDEYADSLSALISDLGIEEKVHLDGFCSDVPERLSRLNVLVHCSTSPEPFGQVIIEGMAHALPVIAAGAGGVREIIRDGENGLLHAPADPESLALALRQVLSDAATATAVGAAGQDDVARRFGISQAAESVAGVYGRMPLNPRS